MNDNKLKYKIIPNSNYDKYIFIYKGNQCINLSLEETKELFIFFENILKK